MSWFSLLRRGVQEESSVSGKIEFAATSSSIESGWSKNMFKALIFLSNVHPCRRAAKSRLCLKGFSATSPTTQLNIICT
jgi:hypothetical protein